ncbi:MULTISPECIES: AarF/ABC1/UbiB kinase family protein [unclassified Marichromatium]|uniref:ABC1 kinase family protein n=1 Tax=unclassified Marichromatium TaxID=2618417 RepID=UPI000F3AAEAC|nr:MULTISPECIES: AarF/ABC1/UbiB kinase family protein [unclassified Marichromatium]RNE91920.1 AarF/ABC1/UbiB kinase family protein [Marichromatium sp. AB31]RNE92326.1 AarF/ABC1/UbiB kinase family protein [Marichromatium sp. AB32]
MTKSTKQPGSAVPSRRLSRLWHLGRATTDLAAGVGVKGMFELARSRNSGEPARIQLSPEHTRRFTERLARMRGAVMKMGQLMSMEGSDIFTPEAAEIMSALRERAEPMPMSQLSQVLEREYGADWDKRFSRFEFKPIAAASIGQVHRAETRDGRRLALKIQFPGVRDSIDSDIDNLALLGQTFGMAPKGIDIKPFLEEARRQLHREADYDAEAEALERYRARLGDDPDFLVPAVHRDLTTRNVLAMDFVDGVPVDRLAGADYRRAARDRAATALMRLTLRELFEFGLVQTDPNFGNYLYDADSGRIALLDFGATHGVAPEHVAAFRRLALATIDSDREGMREASVALGYMGADDPVEHIGTMLDLLQLAAEPLSTDDHYDFGTSDLFERVYRQGRELFRSGAFSTAPAPETMFLHRKFMGSFMLSRRLRARVDLAAMVEGVIRPPAPAAAAA